MQKMDWLTSWMGDHCCCRNSQSLDPSYAEVDIPDPLGEEGGGRCKPKPRLFFFFFFGWVTTAAAATVSHLIQVVQKWMFPILWGEGVDRNPDSSSSSVFPSYFSGVHHFG